jgi:kinesin family protein 3/17
MQYLVRASFLELYNEEIRDLLSKGSKKLDIREKPNAGKNFYFDFKIF